MTESFDFNPTDGLGVGAIGVPGKRRFFLRARSGGRSIVLNCEKFLVQGLVNRLQALLGERGLSLPDLDLEPPPPAPPGDAEWAVAELGVGFHEGKERFVVVARELVADDASIDPASARFWITPEQAVDLSRQALAVIAGGRPTCTYCGLPIDPGGHPCPAANGTRPIF